MLETFTASTFQPLVRECFRVHPGEAPPVELELLQVTLLTASGPGWQTVPRRRDPFSLLFRGPQAPVLPQKIHRFEHPALGSFDLFIVPIRAGAEGTEYEAIFT